MDKRSVLQWDKDDCAATGLVKFDLLGLGMLTALHLCIDLVREHRGYEVDLAHLPQEDEVYEMLCRADTVGVFQIESRAQMATLPRLRPREFYDLVVEVALIRPGPIQGGSVHPYIRRRNGQEAVTYLHPLLENILGKTLGVPLFQEQLMQMAIDVAGFTPAEADQLRQAMGSKRSRQRMERLRQRLYDGMAERGITGEIADELFVKMAAFANYGFPESHSVSFAYLVYSSSWLKYHEPAAFCAALINAQPMGFWSPHTLDAGRPPPRRGRAHAGPQRLAGAGHAGAVPVVHRRCRRAPGDRFGARHRLGSRRGDRGRPRRTRRSRRWCAPCRRCTLAAAGGDGHGRRCSASASAWSGARRCGRSARRCSRGRVGCPASSSAPRRRRSPAWTPVEEAVADLWATGVSPDGHPTRFLRDVARRAGRRHVDGPVGRRAAVAGAGRRRRHPPPAADDRPGRDVPQPGGRDRPDQRRRLQGLLGALPQGRPRRPGDADPRPPGAQRRGDQRRRRRADGAARARRATPAATSAEACRRSSRCSERHGPQVADDTPVLDSPRHPKGAATSLPRRRQVIPRAVLVERSLSRLSQVARCEPSPTASGRHGSPNEHSRQRVARSLAIACGITDGRRSSASLPVLQPSRHDVTAPLGQRRIEDVPTPGRGGTTSPRTCRRR